MTNMKTIYTVYQLNEKVNELGNPYIGFTDNLIRRAKRWKTDLNLEHVPNLIPLYFSTEDQQAFNWEQNKRVENGWRREPPLTRLRNMQKNSRIAATKSEKLKENCRKLGLKMTSNKQHQSNAGKVSGKNAVKDGRLDKAREKSVIVNTKITNEEVQQIKKMYKKGVRGFGYGPIATKFNVSTTLIRLIISGSRRNF